MEHNYLVHSAKGTTWKNHKYVKIVNGKYYYSDDLASGVSSGDKQTSSSDVSSYLNSLKVDPKKLGTSKGKKGSSGKSNSSKSKSSGSEKSSSSSKEKTSKATKSKETKQEKETKPNSYYGVKNAISKKISIGEKDSLYSTANDDGSWNAEVVYEDGSRQTFVLDSNYNIVSYTEKEVKHSISGEYYLVHSTDDYLEHHGILGQKWGVRRYQNPDGTLTEAGRKRLAKAETYRDKANEYKSKVPAHYLTDFGKAKAEKYTRKAANAEGKAYKIEKKLGVNKKEPVISNKKEENIKTKEYSKEQKICLDNKNEISKSVYEELVSDLKRWSNENPNDGYYKELLSKENLANLEKKIKDQVEDGIKGSYNDPHIYKDEITIDIGSFDEYQDAVPLAVVYDLSAKKLKDIYYI